MTSFPAKGDHEAMRRRSTCTIAFRWRSLGMLPTSRPGTQRGTLCASCLPSSLAVNSHRASGERGQQARLRGQRRRGERGGGDAHALALIAALRRREGRVVARGRRRGGGERGCAERVCACGVRVVTPHATTTTTALKSALICFTPKTRRAPSSL